MLTLFLQIKCEQSGIDLMVMQIIELAVFVY